MCAKTALKRGRCEALNTGVMSHNVLPWHPRPQQFSCNQLRCHGNSNLTPERLVKRKRETAKAVFFSCLNLRVYPLPLRSMSHLRAVRPITHHFSTAHLPGLMHAGSLQLCLSSVCLFCGCSFYVLFDPPSCQNPPLTPLKEEKKPPG